MIAFPIFKPHGYPLSPASLDHAAWPKPGCIPGLNLSPGDLWEIVLDQTAEILIQ